MLVLKFQNRKDSGKMSKRDDFYTCSPITCCSRTQGRSCDQTCNGEVGIIEQFMDRRHHFRLRQTGMNDMNGKSDMNGKNETTGTDGGNGKNEYSFSEPLAAVQDSVPVNRFLLVGHFANRHPRMSCARRIVKTEHLVRAPQTHIL